MRWWEIISIILRIITAIPTLWAGYKWFTGAADDFMAITLGPAEYFALTGAGILAMLILSWAPICTFYVAQKAKRPTEQFKSMYQDILDVSTIYGLRTNINDASRIIPTDKLTDWADKVNSVNVRLSTLGISTINDFDTRSLGRNDQLYVFAHYYRELAKYAYTGDLKSACSIDKLTFVNRLA